MIEILKWLKGPEGKVIEKIISAFPPTSPLNEQNVVAAEAKHIEKCDECRDAQQNFTGKTREAVLADERNYPNLVNAFDFLTPEAWHYFLPAFLIQDLIRHRQRFDMFWNYSQPGKIAGNWAKRIELLDGPQCEALIEYLEFHRPFANAFGNIAELSRILEWWQSIYQEKVARKPKTV